MPIIAFWNENIKEVGQTLSVAALSIYMAIEHNKKILSVATGFRDSSLENCFWKKEKLTEIEKQMIREKGGVDLDTGIDGLVKIVNSNKTSTTIISNYAKVIFKDRLDVLLPTKLKEYSEYRPLCSFYPELLKVANKNYDLVFVDLSKKMPREEQRRILEIADVIVIGVTQDSRSLESLEELRNENSFFKKTGVMIHIGKYDRSSKYNIKNVTRYYKQPRDITTVPYTTLFMETANEGEAVQYFLKFRGLAEKEQKLFGTQEENQFFMKEMKRFSQTLLDKLQEIQMKL